MSATLRLTLHINDNESCLQNASDFILNFAKKEFFKVSVVVNKKTDVNKNCMDIHFQSISKLLCRQAAKPDENVNSILSSLIYFKPLFVIPFFSPKAKATQFPASVILFK